MDEKTKINFGGIVAEVKQDPSVTNTNRFCVKTITWKKYVFAGEEIILLKSILQGFIGNRMSGKTYKITDEVNAKMIKKNDIVMLYFFDKEINVEMLDKIYAGYTNDVLRAILSRLPVYIFD